MRAASSSRYCTSSATGRPVALLVQYLLDEAARMVNDEPAPAPKAAAGAKGRKR